MTTKQKQAADELAARMRTIIEMDRKSYEELKRVLGEVDDTVFPQLEADNKRVLAAYDAACKEPEPVTLEELRQWMDKYWEQDKRLGEVFTDIKSITSAVLSERAKESS